MLSFIQRHADLVTGVLSGFDCLRFRGTKRLRIETTVNDPYDSVASDSRYRSLEA